MNKQQVTQSMDYKWHARCVKTFLALWGIVAVVCIFVCMFAVFTDKQVLFSFAIGVVAAAAFGLIFLPLCISHWVGMSRLTKSAEGFVANKAVLDTPHFTDGKNKKAYFTVTFSDKDGKTIYSDTAPLFGSGMWAVYLFEDYNNKLVDIAYNAATNKVIVLGIVD